MRTTRNEKKRTLLDSMIVVRRELLSAARRFPENEADTPFLGVWSVKDLVAHLIGWDHTNLEALTQILAGQYPTFLRYYDKDWATYNRQLVRTYSQPTLSALLEDAQASHERLVEFLEALPPDVVVKGKARSERGRTVTIANLLRAETADEDEHAAQIHVYLETLAGGPPTGN